MTQDNKPKYVAVPITVFHVVLKTLSALPYEQVSVVMNELAQCNPVALQNDENIGDVIAIDSQRTPQKTG